MREVHALCVKISRMSAIPEFETLIHWLFRRYTLGTIIAKDESEIRLTVAAILLESRVRIRTKTKNTNEL
jgi:hypothetical protein